MKSRRYVPRETQIQGAILEALYLDRRVVWVARMNTGAARYVDERGKKRIVKFGFPGCPDILGQLQGGKLLALEVKTSSGKVTAYQQQFIDKALASGACAGIVRNIDQALELVRLWTME